MKKIYFIATLVTFASLVGCSKPIEGEDSNVTVAQTELSIGLPIEISRTAVDADGKASWVEGDTFALWAENRTGGFNINGEEFQMMYYWHSLQSAVFTSNANSLAEGTYIYYAVSPMPNSISNRKATYTLPAVQQGDSFNGAYDIMVAEPVEAEALSADKVNNLALDFQHKMHTLKMTIPTGGNKLKAPVKQVVFTFPTNVVGTFTIEANAPQNAPVVSSGGKQLIVETPNGFDVGKTAWATILPANISGEVSYYAISTIGQRTLERKFSLSKECLAGHITPLSLTIPEPIPPTIIRLPIGKNNLGEAVQTITIFDHNNKQIQKFTANSSNTYDLVEYGLAEEGLFRTYSGKVFTVRFESKSAIVERQITLPTINKYVVNTLASIEVPYLFFEDFSCIHTAGESYGDDSDSDGEERNQPGVLLDPYMSHTGWNAARFELGVGTCARINVRWQTVIGFTSTHRGRLDTPPLKNLKSGASVNVKIEFNSGCATNVSRDSKYGSLSVTTHNNLSNPLNGVATGTAQSGNISEYGHVWWKQSMSDSYTTDSWTSSFPGHSTVANGVTNGTRICFYPDTSYNPFTIGNEEWWFYIDNIKVSIAQ